MFLIKQKILSRRDWALSADIQSMRGIRDQGDSSLLTLKMEGDFADGRGHMARKVDCL